MNGRSRKKCCSLVGHVVSIALLVAWIFANYVIIQLQVDKSDMTVLKYDQNMFFVNSSSNPDEMVRDARKQSSRIYNWLVHGSPKTVVPWDSLLDGGEQQPWLNATLLGHCDRDQLALFAQGKIDETRCGVWARPRYDGCAGGFFSNDYTLAAAFGREEDPVPAQSCPTGTLCPNGFTCFIACLYGASCRQSTPHVASAEKDEVKCSWPVHLKHTKSKAYSSPDGDVSCPGVEYEVMCPAKYFCPNPSAVPQICPRSHYCPQGSYKPKHCPFFTQCSQEGLDAPDIHVAAAAALLGSFAACLIIFQSSRFVRNRLRRFREAVHEKRRRTVEMALEQRALRMASPFMQHQHGLVGRSDNAKEDDDEYIFAAMVDGSYSEDEDEEKRAGTEVELASQLIAGTAGIPANNPRLPHGHSRKRSANMLRSLKEKSAGERVDFEFERLGLSVLESSSGKQLKVLEAATGSFRHGHVSAILGPSGAGKSTLMKVLCGRVDRAKETVTSDSVVKVNGDESVSLRSLAPLCAFVPQDDVMHTELSVLELLEFSAASRLPQGSRGRRAVVRDVLRAVGLQKYKHSVVGDAVKRGISGGQRKRCNLALELVADPCVLFADEVTSGLDSATSLNVIEVLHALAAKGANVVVVLHQPSLTIFNSFTSVLLLAPGGRTAYLGPPRGARIHFERLDFRCPKELSPPDFYMQLLSTSARALRVDLASEWSRAISAATATNAAAEGEEHDSLSSKHEIEEAAFDRKPPGWLTQLFLQLARALTRQRRVAWSIAGDIAIQALAGGGIGLLYTDFAFKNAQLVNFMVSIALGMTLTLAAVSTLGAKGRAVFIRECCKAGGGGLSASAFFVAVNVADLPRLAALATVFVITFYPLAHPRCSLGIYVLATCCDAFAASGFGYVAGAVFESEQTAQIAALCSALVFGMFSGVHPTIRQMQRPLRIVHYVSHDRYFVELLFLEEITHMSEASRMPPSFYASPSSSVLAQLLAYGYLVLDVSAYWANHYIRWLDISTLVAIGFASRVLAYVCLVQFNQAALCRESNSSMFYRYVVACAKRLKISRKTRRADEHSRTGASWRFSPLRPDMHHHNSPLV